MSETENQQAQQGDVAPPKRGRLMVFSLVGVLMLLEAGGIFVAVRMMYHQPEVAEGATDEGEQNLRFIDKEVEVDLGEVNAFNKREGRLMLFNLDLAIRINRDDEERVKKVLEARRSTIQDRLNTVIRSAELKYLNEPGLETIRRQFKAELNDLLGDDLVQEILVRKFFQTPADS